MKPDFLITYWIAGEGQPLTIELCAENKAHAIAKLRAGYGNPDCLVIDERNVFDLRS